MATATAEKLDITTGGSNFFFSPTATTAGNLTVSGILSNGITSTATTSNHINIVPTSGNTLSGNIYLSTGDIVSGNVRIASATTGTISVTDTNVFTVYENGLYSVTTGGDLTAIYKTNPVKEIIKDNLLIRVKHRGSGILGKWSLEEQRAQDTLRDMLTEKDWRRYVTNGFIMVRGASNNWYQIFSSREKIRVYRDGKITHKICIHSDDKCPPTDHVINMKVMVELDEISLWDSGNVYSTVAGGGITFDATCGNVVFNIPKKRSIIDIYKDKKEGRPLSQFPLAVTGTVFSISNNQFAIAC